MAKVLYVQCPKCQKEYYIDRKLLNPNAPGILLKCPYCKNRFKNPMIGNRANTNTDTASR